MILTFFASCSQPDVSSRLKSLSLFSKSNGWIHSIKLPHSSKTPSLAESKFCKTSPSFFSYYLSNETIHALVMNEACVAVLFAYKLLHNFAKAIDEI